MRPTSRRAAGWQQRRPGAPPPAPRTSRRTPALHRHACCLGLPALLHATAATTAPPPATPTTNQPCTSRGRSGIAPAASLSSPVLAPKPPSLFSGPRPPRGCQPPARPGQARQPGRAARPRAHTRSAQCCPCARGCRSRARDRKPRVCFLGKGFVQQTCIIDRGARAARYGQFCGSGPTGCERQESKAPSGGRGCQRCARPSLANGLFGPYGSGALGGAAPACPVSSASRSRLRASAQLISSAWSRATLQDCESSPAAHASATARCAAASSPLRCSIAHCV